MILVIALKIRLLTELVPSDLPIEECAVKLHLGIDEPTSPCNIMQVLLLLRYEHSNKPPIKGLYSTRNRPVCRWQFFDFPRQACP